MTLLSITPSGRLYISRDVYELFKFALKFNGEFLPDFEEALKGNYVVKI